MTKSEECVAIVNNMTSDVYLPFSKLPRINRPRGTTSRSKEVPFWYDPQFPASDLYSSSSTVEGGKRELDLNNMNDNVPVN